MPKTKRHLFNQPLSRPIPAVVAAVNVIAALVTITSAYAGYLNPLDHPWSGIAAMCFPVIATAMTVLSIITLLINWRAGLIGVAGLVMCTGPLLDNCPLNPAGLYTRETPPGKRSFSLLTYNVYNLNAVDNQYPTDSINATLDYILDRDADIVCLQETNKFNPRKDNCTTPEQFERIKKKYPYSYYPFKRGIYLTILSKYPMRPIESSILEEDRHTIMTATVNIDGTVVNLVNVHLKSFGLTSDDKSLYHDITSSRPNRNELHDVKTRLFSKIAEATMGHAGEARRIEQYLDSVGGNAIVCGDFNDVPGSYVIRSLTRYGLQPVYPETGFGPAITYNTNRFYFRIDHILYRGDFSPLWIKVGDIDRSDHYPLMTRFVIDG